jgi:hypothetical protein
MSAVPVETPVKMEVEEMHFLPQRGPYVPMGGEVPIERGCPSSLGTDDDEIRELALIGGLDPFEGRISFFLASALTRLANAIPP